MQTWQSGKSRMMDFLQNIPKHKLDYRYAEGEWTPKQVLLHVSDTKRIYSFRALFFGCFYEEGELKGFDENIFAEKFPCPRTFVSRING